MAFTFIHTADWQLGAQFGAMPADVAARLQAARLDAIDRIAGVARAAKADHVFVAGDVFDDVKPPQRLVGQTLARLAKHTDLVWHFLPGNHDPVQAGSVWQDVARAGAGSHVRLHLSADPVEIASGVLLLPAPLTAKALSHDPTAYMDGVTSAAGVVRIGMAHGSVRGFSSEGEAAIPISADRAAAARLDYLALGDWHGAVKINPRTWYSGTPEPDRTKDNGPGHVLVVGIAAAGALPDVRQVATASFRWQQVALDVQGASGVDRLTERLRAGDFPGDRVLLKLDLGGRMPLAEAQALEQSLDRLRDSVAHFVVDRSGLVLSTSEADLEALGGGAIATVAADLAEQARDGDDRQKVVATRALQVLAQFAGAAP